MASTTGWIAGRGVGLTWTAAFGGELVSLAAGSTMTSTVVISNSVLDIYADIEARITFTSFTATLGSFVGVYLATDHGDGLTFGDGYITTPNTARAQAPPFGPVGTIPVQTLAANPLVAGVVQGILLPPGPFRWAIFNGITLQAFPSTGANIIVNYRTYNLNLNA